MLVGRAAIQRHLDRLETWLDGNLLKFSQGKCKVSHLGYNNPMQQDRQALTAGRRLFRKGPGGLGRKKLEYDPGMCPCTKGSQWYPRLHHQECSQQVHGSDPSFQLSTG